MYTAGGPGGRAAFGQVAAPDPRRLRRLAIAGQVIAVLFMIGIGIAGVTIATTPKPELTADHLAVGPDMHPHLLVGFSVLVVGVGAGLALLIFALRAERRADAAERSR